MAPELLNVILSTVFCVMFFVILMLVMLLFRRDLLCCRLRPYETQYTDNIPHYNSRHSLIGIAHNEHTAAMNQRAFGPQLPGRLFIIGKPNDYHLDGPLARLPSYESVRKKDRQRQIHSMIAQRFGLTGCHDEPPPTYEETFHHSIDMSPADVHLTVHTLTDTLNIHEDADGRSQPLQQPAST